MRAPTGWLLADSASDTGVHYGWPDDDDDDDDGDDDGDDEWMWRIRKQMRAKTLLADSASDAGVHYGWPNDNDDDDQIRPLNFVCDTNDGNATNLKALV